MPDMDALRAWVSYDDDKKNAAALEKRAKRKCAEVEPVILESFIEDGVDSIRVTLEATDVDAEAKALIEAVLPDETKAILRVEGDEEVPIVDSIVHGLREEGLLRDSRPEIVKTVFIGSRVWAKPVPTGVDDDGEPKASDADYERACAALARAGWDDYVQTRFNVISLSSAMKIEKEQGRIEIPEGEDSVVVFDGTIIVTEIPQLNARKAK